MCYSAQVEQSMTATERRFSARLNPGLFASIRFLQGYEREIGPKGVKELLGMSRVPKASQFRWAPDEQDHRVYPNYFAPVIVYSESKRIIVPMRYRVRPAGMPSEVPSKYNVFNARIDSLQTKRTWRGLFGKTHALFPFISFYEWVEQKGKKVQISFSPENHKMMWAPALYDTWSSQDGKVTFSSFAVITDEPPDEIAAAGHDRCPIFLREDLIDEWLQPEGKSMNDLLSILQLKERTYYENRIVAAS